MERCKPVDDLLLDLVLALVADEQREVRSIGQIDSISGLRRPTYSRLPVSADGGA
jgi:hypothetical protein